MRWAGILLLVAAGCAEAHGPEPSTHAVLDRTSTPVLLLPARYMEAAEVMAQDRWYAIDYEDETISVHLHGTVAFVEPPAGLNPDELDHNIQVRGHDGFDELDEDIRMISWMENGAAYSIELICRNAEDERCTSGDFAASIAADMEARR